MSAFVWEKVKACPILSLRTFTTISGTLTLFPGNRPRMSGTAQPKSWPHGLTGVASGGQRNKKEFLEIVQEEAVRK